MSDPRPRAYRFATPGQWRTGLFATADREVEGLQPFALFASEALRLPMPRGAWAPAIVAGTRLLWRGGEVLHEVSARNDDSVETRALSGSLAIAQRIAASASTLWVIGDDGSSLDNYDLESLVTRMRVQLGDRVLDIAFDGRGGAWALVARGLRHHAVHVSCNGLPGRDIQLPEAARNAFGIAYVRRYARLLVVANGGTRLWIVDEKTSGVLRIVDLNEVRPCFVASTIASGAAARVALGGVDHPAFGAGALVLQLDHDGDSLGMVPLPEPATGIAVARNLLAVTTATALLRFVPASSPGDVRAPVTSTFVTPKLRSPASGLPRLWLRAEALATLPAGTALEITYAATDDERVAAEAERLAQKPGMPEGTRLQRLDAHLAPWSVPVVFRGGTAASATWCAAPLHDVRKTFVWIRLRLTGAAGAALPRVGELRVLYPGPSLMQHLPEIFQRDQDASGSFLPALVGVLEATTQELDTNIGALGRLVHPRTADSRWLDFVARWLGLPWNDALSVAQKRTLVLRAREILRSRGTRVGLVALLESVLPEGRFRIVDFGVDYERARVGSPQSPGPRLPAVLGGLPSSAIVLNRKAIVGRARLMCAGAEVDCDGAVMSRLRVEIVANGAERAAWSPWLADLMADVVPFDVKVELRWRHAGQRRTPRIGDDLVLAEMPHAQIGVDAVLGQSQLTPARAVAITEPGVEVGARLG